jgi:PKD repeat protein
MAHPSRLGSPVLRLFSCLLVMMGLLLSPAQIWAKGCAESLPGAAVGPPPTLWGQLQPEKILLDATTWTGSQRPTTRYPISTSVDIENGWVFQSFYGGFSIYDARANPADPQRVSLIGGYEGGFPGWPPAPGEFTQIVFYIDAPEGNDNLAAVAGVSNVGVSIWDTTNKSSPHELYQDTSKYSYQVYAARIGGRDYVFAADFQSDYGLHVYDMTAAKSLSVTPCVQDSGACAGVSLGRIGAREAAKYVHGLAVGSRHFVVKSGGDTAGTGISIWEVTNPHQPSLVVEDFRGFGQNGSTHGVAMWSQNGHHYLAARHKGDGKIFDITSCLTTGCSNLQSLQVWKQALKPYPESIYWLSATFSRSGTTPFVYFGNHDTCRDAEAPFQTEYLYDVSNAAVPVDVTPPNHITDLGVSVDYWSWYYSDTIRGYGHFGPRMAKFSGQYLYRAAATIFDIHKWTGGSPTPPVANFTWTDPVYQGDPVTFSSTSTGAVTSYAWTFQDGSPSSATSSAPQTTFTSPGAKSVSLTAINAQGSSLATRSVTVLDPSPAVSSITASPANPLVCQPVTLTANNVGGRAPVTVSWTVANGPLQVASGTGNPFIWLSSGAPAGTYAVNVTVSKPGFPSASTSTQVTLGALPPLPNAGFAVTNDPFVAGTVQFHAATANTGATTWAWDFGDGTPVTTVTDPVAGPNPIHSYTATGSYSVKVSVNNCAFQQLPPIPSATLPVTITQVAPLAITNFQAQCQLFCDFSPGQSIPFTVVVTGNPTQYEYDWNGNGFGGADDQNSATPVTSHTYAATGTYVPVMRLRRGAEVSQTFEHPTPINIRTSTPPPPPPGPSVSVSGPSSGQTGQAYTFTAAGSNCTAGTWTWNGGAGGAVTSNGSSATITWSTAGSKTVQATTSGCGTGSRAVNITDPSTGGLRADFSFSPASPAVNQAVSFNGSASTGAPTLYFWEFGDGSNADGTTVSHAYAAGGTYTAKLTVLKDCTAGICGSQASTTKTVVVGAGPSLIAGFDTSATCSSDLTGVRCDGSVGTSYTFTSTSTGATSFTWTFNDGSTATGPQVTHAWTGPGSFLVQLTAGNGTATASASRLFVITGTPQLAASFNTSAPCTSDVTGVRCDGKVGEAVSFTSTSTGATSYSWNFNDGTPAGSGAQVSHTWNAPGSYLVQLTAGNGSTSASTSRLFVVTGDPIAQTRSVVLPWIAQTRGALVQSSDLYVNNPGTTVMDVTLEFRKRGVPESNPPRISKTIPPGSTLYVADVLRELFSRENVAGFVTVKVDKGNAEPIITSFNTTFQADGKQFGQTVSGVSMSSAGSPASTGPESRMQHLVGLINNTERLAYFGLSNPSEEPVIYRLRFFDKEGRLISESSQDLTLSRFGQRQYQVKEIHDLFGISSEADYRIEIERVSGGQVVPYASNLRLSSEDPSFIEPGSSKSSKSYLIGALSAPGLNNSLWQSDVLLSNITSQSASADVTFTSVGLTSTPTPPLHVTLQPGKTERLENVIASQWGIRNAIGVLTVSSTATGGIFPIVQGESYENTNPTKRFGQSMTAVSEADAAPAGKKQYLVGLRQDAKNRTTLWIFNPGTVTGEYDVIYRKLDGSVLGTVPNVRLGAGKMRQFGSGQHPFPATGVPNGFTVEIVVKSGKVLGAAQVINNVTNDPAYIQGEVR